jgi:hypothetical protein
VGFLFLWAKELNEKYTHKGMFPVYDGKCLSRKAVHNMWQTFRCWRKGRNRGAEVADTTVKNFYAAGFGALVKRWEKRISVGGGYVEK